jgi:hypothetical protein
MRWHLHQGVSGQGVTPPLQPIRFSVSDINFNWVHLCSQHPRWGRPNPCTSSHLTSNSSELLRNPRGFSALWSDRPTFTTIKATLSAQYLVENKGPGGTASSNNAGEESPFHLGSRRILMHGGIVTAELTGPFVPGA